MSKSLTSPPAHNEFELSLFGPGRGECALLHVGMGDWICVDSCIDPTTRNPVALSYLSGIGVDPSGSLRHIVVTHWHHDHMRGVAEIVRAAPLAQFLCSGALRTPEFFTAVAMGEERYRNPGLSELAEIFRTLEERRPSGMSAETVSPVWVQEGSLILERPATAGCPAVSVRALSPSHGARRLGMRELDHFMPVLRRPKRRAVAFGPNQQSIAIWVEAGPAIAILGGDLEESSDAGIGWKAVLASPILPRGRAGMIKVPRHGSKNADNPDIWSLKLIKSPIAALTPFASASRPVPSERDLDRLVSRTPHVYCTANPTGKRPTTPDRAVLRKIRTVPRRMRDILGSLGHIRIRARLESNDSADEPTVELFSGAFRVRRAT